MVNTNFGCYIYLVEQKKFLIKFEKLYEKGDKFFLKVTRKFFFKIYTTFYRHYKELQIWCLFNLKTPGLITGCLYVYLSVSTKEILLKAGPIWISRETFIGLERVFIFWGKCTSNLYFKVGMLFNLFFLLINFLFPFLFCFFIC